MRPNGTLQGPPSRLKGSGWAACPWVHPSRAGRWDRERDPLWYPAAGEGLHSPITQGAEPLAGPELVGEIQLKRSAWGSLQAGHRDTAHVRGQAFMGC